MKQKEYYNWGIGIAGKFTKNLEDKMDE